MYHRPRVQVLPQAAARLVWRGERLPVPPTTMSPTLTPPLGLVLFCGSQSRIGREPDAIQPQRQRSRDITRFPVSGRRRVVSEAIVAHNWREPKTDCRSEPAGVEWFCGANHPQQGTLGWLLVGKPRSSRGKADARYSTVPVGRRTPITVPADPRRIHVGSGRFSPS